MMVFYNTQTYTDTLPTPTLYKHRLQQTFTAILAALARDDSLLQYTDGSVGDIIPVAELTVVSEPVPTKFISSGSAHQQP